MLLTRLDVTIQSFQWSDRTRGKDDIFERIYHEKRKLLKADPDIDISDLLCARTDLAVIEKTSNANVRKNTRTAINKVIIGQVPDRGGRSWEQAPPPPEMPSWQQRSAPLGGGSRGGGRGGDTRGGGQQRGGFGRGGGGRSNDFQTQGRGYQDRGSSSYQDNRGEAGGYSNRGDYDKRYSGGNAYENRGHDNYSNYNNRNDNYSGRGGNNSYSYNRRDSGGYGGQDFQQNKRPKTYDSFQANKNTYADQYVQEREHNQQYQRGGRDSYQRGRSSYHRGGGSYR